MRQKKGISPLVATVLLVGFVIVLAVLLWIFLSGEVADIAEKAGNQCTPSQAAMATVDVRACQCSSTSCQVQISNTGQGAIDGVRVRLKGGDEIISVNNPWQLGAGETNVLEVSKQSLSADVEGAEVIPFFIEGGVLTLCDQNLVEVDCE